MASAKATIDHEEIKAFVEQTGGCPAHVKSTGSKDDPGILRIDYPGYSGKQSLEQLDWDTWFEAFDANELAFLYTPGGKSRFSKLVSRASVDVESSSSNGTSNGKQNGARNGKKTAKKRSRIDAIKLLEQQHRDVEAQFARFEDATTKRDKERIFNRIADMLAAHATIEEQYFYPNVMTDRTEDRLREAVEEHLAVKRLIADCLELEANDEQFKAKVMVMKEMVEHHVEEEEEELFKLVEKEDLVDLSQMGEQMEQEFKTLMRQKPRNEVPNETEQAAEL